MVWLTADDGDFCWLLDDVAFALRWRTACCVWCLASLATTGSALRICGRAWPAGHQAGDRISWRAMTAPRGAADRALAAQHAGGAPPCHYRLYRRTCQETRRLDSFRVPGLLPE
jgi:hypothetical protein